MKANNYSTDLRNHALMVLIIFMMNHAEIFAQLTVNNTGITPQQLANQLAGNGVTISNVVLTGDPSMAGTFTATGSNLGLSSGIMLCTAPATLGIGPNISTSSTVDMFLPGDPALDALSFAPTYDACILEFDFVPQSSFVSFRYVFASEEYPEYVCSIYNDVFAFFINGPGISGTPNIAIIPSSTTPVTINAVNNGTVGTFGSASNPGCILSYSGYYVDNTAGATIEFDAFTTVLSAQAIVVPCQTYHMRLALADAGDGRYDSGVFLEQGSFTSPPAVNAGPDVTFCSGNSAQLGTAASPGWTYSWSPANGLSDPTISNPTVTLVNSGSSTVTNTFIVTATSGSCVLTDTVAVTVTPGPSAAFTPTGSAICEGQSVNFNYTGSAGSSTVFTWNFTGGNILSGSGQGPYSVSYPSAGNYSVTLTVNDAGCSSTFTDSVFVSTGPTATFNTSSPACTGDTVQISYTGNGINGAVYTWNFGNAIVVNGSGSGPYEIIYQTAGTFPVTLDVSAPGCQPDQSSANIDIGSVMVNAGMDTTVCDASVITLGQAANPGITYSWSPSAGLSDPSLAQPTLTATNVTGGIIYNHYVVTATDGICFSYDTITVGINAIPVCSFTVSDDSVCVGENVDLIFNGAATAMANFNWDFQQATIISGNGMGPYTAQFNTPGIYTISLLVDDNGCTSNPSTQSVNVSNALIPSVAVPVSACVGDTVNVQYTGPANPQNPVWDFSGGTLISGSGTGPYLVTYTDTGIYSVMLTISNTDCPAASVTESITIDQAPLPSFSVSATEGCAPLTVQFSAQGAGPSDLYTWIISGAVSHQPSPEFTFPNGGIYDVALSITSPHGCSSGLTQSQRVTVFPKPSAEFQTDPAAATLISPLINFINYSSNADVYQWDFGDGTGAQFISGIHQYGDTGTYPVTLIANNVNGCTDTVRGVVRINGEFSFYVPNAITPNNDGINDVFRGYGTYLTSYEMWIYNRWGDMVFHTNSYEDAWDGSINSTVQNDTYIYKIIVKDYAEVAYNYYGSVNVIK
jgi:gliding motility-associated-like protein